MNDLTYVEKFERVVDLMRYRGAYSAIVTADPDVYELTSDVVHNLAVTEYVLLNTSMKVRVVAVISGKVFQVKVFEQIIAASGEWKAMAPYTDYGTRKTINRKMLDKNSGEFQYQKFPLIALRIPSTNQKNGDVYSFDANVIIATFTSKQHYPQQRMANVFNPILYPIVERFINMLKRSGEFINFRFEPQQIDRMFYGTESGELQNIKNIFDDPLDAVELRNLELRYLVDNCVQN